MKIERVRTKREHKIDVLSAWLKWANDRDSPLPELTRELMRLVNVTTGVGYEPPTPTAIGEQLGWLQGQVLAAFAFCENAAPEDEYEVPTWRADMPAPRFVLTKGHGTTARYEGSPAEVGRLALCVVLMHPELRRITRCIVRGCNALLVGRKSGRYCVEHASV